MKFHPDNKSIRARSEQGHNTTQITGVFLVQIRSKYYRMSMLLINSQQTLYEIQELFSKMFPFLKIEFFRKGVSEKLRKEKLPLNDIKVQDVPNVKKFGRMSFESNMTVAQVESVFRSECGLNIQIFRKSGPIWLETTATSNWTLEQQNQEAEILQNYLTEAGTKRTKK
jgi:hypothetical protein